VDNDFVPFAHEVGRHRASHVSKAYESEHKRRDVRSEAWDREVGR
jgi:hypothetical protein